MMKKRAGLLVMAGSVIVVVVAFLLVLQIFGDQIGVNTNPSDEVGAESSSDDVGQTTLAPEESKTDELMETTGAEQPELTDEATGGATEASTEESTEGVTDDSTEAVTQDNGWQEWIRKEEEALAEGKNIIYLTFDDGPSEYTTELLDMLDKYGIKATFFVTGDAPLYNHLIGLVAERGHSIGLHCSVHWYDEIYANDETFLANMAKIDQMVYDYAGYRTKLMRFPGGSSNQISKQYCEGIMTRMTAYMESQGYHYFDWNVDSGDGAGEKDKDKLVENIISGIKLTKTAVVLQHDTCESSIAAAEEVIIWGLQNGYVFLPLTENSPVIHHGVAN